MFRITMQFGGKPIRKYTFDKEVISIGRDSACDIVIENIGASRRHATVESTDEGYVLADLKSHNGTFVHGEKIFHHRLTDADEFYIGKYCFLFETLEPVVNVEDDGVEEEPAQAIAGMPDMTFRLDRKEIERIMGASARGSQTQLVQLAPETEKQTLALDKPYYVIGAAESAEIRLKGFLAPKIAAVVIRGDHGHRIVSVSKRVKVNSKRMADGPLQDGDLISVAGRRYRFCQG